MSGIGGKDSCVTPLWDGGDTIVPFTVSPGPATGEITLRRGDDKPVILPCESFRQIVEWLKSWGYI